MKQEIIEALKKPEVAKAIGEGVNDAVIKALKDAGVECTDDDIKELFKAPEGKLSDEELENVAGGSILEKIYKAVCDRFVATNIS